MARQMKPLHRLSLVFDPKRRQWRLNASGPIAVALGSVGIVLGLVIALVIAPVRVVKHLF
jgi:hypothetical protein